MKTLLTIAALTLTTGTLLAEHHAGDEKKQRGAKFANADVNGDGFLTKAEMLEAHTQRINDKFSKLDSDGDGKLSKDELKKGHRAMKKRMKQDLAN